MSTWTIYDHPRDFPEGYIARRWDLMDGQEEPVWTPNVFTAMTLEGVREQLPWGLVPFGRNPGDAPSIVETWL